MGAGIDADGGPDVAIVIVRENVKATGGEIDQEKSSRGIVSERAGDTGGLALGLEASEIVIGVDPFEIILVFLGEPRIPKIVGHEVVAVEGVLNVFDISDSVVGVDPNVALGISPFFQASTAIVFVAGNGTVGIGDGEDAARFIEGGAACVAEGIDFHGHAVQCVVLLLVELAGFVAGDGFVAVEIVGVLDVVAGRIGFAEQTTGIVVGADGGESLGDGSASGLRDRDAG